MSDKYTEKDLEEHLKIAHNQSPFSTYLREIVYGGNDGIVTTFAVVAGFTGANSGEVAAFSFVIVLLFGLSNLFADATSMGLGNFLSIRSQKGVYKNERRKEKEQMKLDPENEKAQTMMLLKKKGFSNEDAKELTEIYSKNENYWIDFMMVHELEMANPSGENPAFTAIATFLSFIVFGFIPLIPYLLSPDDVKAAFFASCVTTLIALITLGLIRWRVTHEKFLRAVLEVVLIGGISAVVAYMVGLFFKE